MCIVVLIYLLHQYSLINLVRNRMELIFVVMKDLEVIVWQIILLSMLAICVLCVVMNLIFWISLRPSHQRMKSV